MCGIAGYSLSTLSAIDRTRAAQALLAGIAERGADAVGYAYRGPEDAYPVVTKQRTPASKLLERISVPETATELLVHVRDYTKGHPSIAANNHPVRHGPVIGIHNRIIVNDDELLADFDCARAEPRMTVGSAADREARPLRVPTGDSNDTGVPAARAGVGHALALPLGQEGPVLLPRLRPVRELRQPPEPTRHRGALPDRALEPLLPHQHVE